MFQQSREPRTDFIRRGATRSVGNQKPRLFLEAKRQLATFCSKSSLPFQLGSARLSRDREPQESTEQCWLLLVTRATVLHTAALEHYRSTVSRFYL